MLKDYKNGDGKPEIGVDKTVRDDRGSSAQLLHDCDALRAVKNTRDVPVCFWLG